MIKLKKKERKRPSRYVAGQLVTAIHNKRWEERREPTERKRGKKKEEEETNVLFSSPTQHPTPNTQHPTPLHPTGPS